MPEADAVFHIRPAEWLLDEAAIARLRREIFIAEQGVPEELEWEAIDPDCHWFLAERGQEVIGVVRLLPNGHIGRMAVSAAWRRQGVGSALLEAVLVAARQAGFGQVALSAQIQAIPFYLRAGFRVQGDEYLDAGIPHRTMILELK
jgi:predicted GNAT family N-acyltransferase